MSYQYYSLPFCAPRDIINQIQSLSDILSGDRVQNTLFDIKMKTNENCKLLCRRTYSEEEIKKFIDAIDNDYYVNLLFNEVSVKHYEHHYSRSKQKHPNFGFKVGDILLWRTSREAKEIRTTYYLYNHLQFIVKYHDVNESHSKTARIVGVEVMPLSKEYKYQGTWSDENPPELCPEQFTNKIVSHNSIILEDAREVIWTYDVLWEPSELEQASSEYLYRSSHEQNVEQNHSFSIFKSFVTVFIYGAFIAKFFYETTLKDTIQIIPGQELRNDEKELLMLISLQGDVFRKPSNLNLFIAIIAIGSQAFLSILFAMVLFTLKIFPPAQFGSPFISFFELASSLNFVGGFVSCRMYKTFNCEYSRFYTNLIAVLFPGFIFVVLLCESFELLVNGDALLISATPTIKLFFVSLGISIPLTHLGVYIGNEYGAQSYPSEDIEISSSMPPRPWYLKDLILFFLGSTSTFSILSSEISFVTASNRAQQYYSSFGYLVLILLLFIMVTSEVAVFWTCLYLKHGDYRWWWKPIIISLGSATLLFVFNIYSIVSYSKAQPPELTVILIVVMFIVSLLHFLVTSAIGFASTYCYVRMLNSKMTKLV